MVNVIFFCSWTLEASWEWWPRVDWKGTAGGWEGGNATSCFSLSYSFAGCGFWGSAVIEHYLGTQSFMLSFANGSDHLCQLNSPLLYKVPFSELLSHLLIKPNCDSICMIGS